MGATAKANLVAETPFIDGNSVAVDQVRVWLRDSIDEARDADGHRLKHEYIAKAMGLEKAYLSQMLSLDPRNQKPIQFRHIVALPDEVECIFARKYAESFGQIVVAPVTEEEARRQLATGLFSLLTPAPRRKSMAKAGLRSQEER